MGWGGGQSQDMKREMVQQVDASGTLVHFLGLGHCLEMLTHMNTIAVWRESSIEGGDQSNA